MCGSGDRQARGEPWKSNRAPGLAADGSFPRQRESLRPSVRLWAADVDPVLPTQSHWTHGILRKVIAQLKSRIFQKSWKFPPECQRVLASLAECAGRQCNGLRCLDLATNIVEKRLGCFLTPIMARGNTRRLAASFGVAGGQFVHPRHNRSCHRVSGIQLHHW